MNDLPLTIRNRAAFEIATPEVRGQERIEQTPLRFIGDLRQERVAGCEVITEVAVRSQ